MTDCRRVAVLPGVLTLASNAAHAAGLEGIGGLGDLLALAGLAFCLVVGPVAGLVVHAVKEPHTTGSASRAAFTGALWGLALFAVVYGIAISLQDHETKTLNDRARAENLRVERGADELAAMQPGTVGATLQRALAILNDDTTPGALVLRRRDGERMAFAPGIFTFLLPVIAHRLRSFATPPTADDFATLEKFIAANDKAFEAEFFQTPSARRQLVTEYYDVLPNGDRIHEDLHGTLFWAAALGGGDAAGARTRCETLPAYAVEHCQRSFDRSLALRRPS